MQRRSCQSVFQFVDRAQHGPAAGTDDVGVGAYAPGDLAVVPAEFNVAAGAGLGTEVQGVFAVVFDGEFQASGFLHRIGEHVQPAVAGRMHRALELRRVDSNIAFEVAFLLLGEGCQCFG